MFSNFNKKGFSLIEMLIYTAILTFFMIISVNAGLIMTRSYARAKTARSLNTAAILSLVKMTNEIKNASSIDPSSLFNSSAGVLKYSRPVDTGIEYSELYLENGKIFLKRNGLDVGALNPADTNISKLLFRNIGTSTVEAVRIEMRIESNSGGSLRSEDFYQTAILRGSYQQ